MSIVISIIAFVFALGLIIFVHEGGHFIFAKRAGILCYDFSLGMGPVLYSKKVGETTYGIRAIPIGGFVSMAGEEVDSSQIKVGDKIGLTLDDDGYATEIILNNCKTASITGDIVLFDLYCENGEELYIDIATNEGRRLYFVRRDAFYIFGEKNNKLQIAPYDRCFESKSIPQRFLSIFAGPAMNFVLAILLFFIVALFTGFASEKNKVGSISGRAEDFLETGDVITKIGETEVTKWDQISDAMQLNLKSDDRIDVTVNREGVPNPNKYSIDPLFLIGNLGVAGYHYDEITNGVKILIYTTKAEAAGLKDDDIITKVSSSIGEENITSWYSLVNYCKKLNGETVKVSVLRDGEEKLISVDTLSNKTLGVVGIDAVDMKIGISPDMEFNFVKSLGAGFTDSWGVVENVFGTLGLLFGGSNDVGVKDLSGPVGIFTLIKNSLTGGFLSYISFVALLSVNIGVLNILPIPALDGGRLVFLGYEAVTRKKVNKKVENIIHSVMFAVLMLFFIYVTFNDIGRLFG